MLSLNYLLQREDKWNLTSLILTYEILYCFLFLNFHAYIYDYLEFMQVLLLKWNIYFNIIFMGGGVTKKLEKIIWLNRFEYVYQNKNIC